MHFEFKMFPLKRQVLKCVPLFDTFVSPGQEQRADETSGCPLERKKVWPDRKFPASAITIGLPVGHNTERLHCFNTVNVSLLCFFIAINSDNFLTGNSQKPWCTRGSVIESKKSLSACQHILTIFWQLFPLDWYVWLEAWAPHLYKLSGQSGMHHMQMWVAFCCLGASA